MRVQGKDFTDQWERPVKAIPVFFILDAHIRQITSDNLKLKLIIN